MAKPLPVIGGPVYCSSNYWRLRCSHGWLLQSFSGSCDNHITGIQQSCDGALLYELDIFTVEDPNMNQEAW